MSVQPEGLVGADLAWAVIEVAGVGAGGAEVRVHLVPTAHDVAVVAALEDAIASSWRLQAGARICR
jgi:hypothetical protein